MECSNDICKENEVFFSKETSKFKILKILLWHKFHCGTSIQSIPKFERKLTVLSNPKLARTTMTTISIFGRWLAVLKKLLLKISM